MCAAQLVISDAQAGLKTAIGSVLPGVPGSGSPPAQRLDLSLEGSAALVAATIRTIFALAAPAAIRGPLGVIAVMLSRQVPKVEAMLHDAADDVTTFAASRTPAGEDLEHQPRSG